MDTEKLGKYRLLSLIATGGMGEVFLARQEGPAGFSKTVVIKRILRHLADDQGFIDMFLNEARLAAQLQHPNIAQIFGLEKESDTWFIAMEHVHGRSCRTCLTEARQRNVRFPPRIAARICAQALQGLHFAHCLTDEAGRSLGILHRDVSPDNVLVSFAGEVKLIDFGIAKAMTRSFKLTGRLKGKFPYMAPEQFVAGAIADARIDVYAMGVLLHELVTLEVPASSPKSPEEAVQRRRPWVARPDLPPALNAILENALQADPSKRWQSAEAFSHALETFIAGSGEPVTGSEVSGFLEQLLGSVVRTNPSLAILEPALGGERTQQLPILKPQNTPLRDLWAVSPLAESALQQDFRGELVPEPKTIASSSEPEPKTIAASPDVDAITMPPEPDTITVPPEPAAVTLSSRRWHLLAPIAGAAAVVLGVVLWAALGPSPAPEVLPIAPTPQFDAVVSRKVAEDAGAQVAAAASSDSVEPPKQTEPPKPKVKRKVPKLGRVTVRAHPATEVFYNGKSYGMTPLKNPVEVAAGVATFTLKNRTLGLTKKVTVKVVAGADVVLKADLAKK